MIILSIRSKKERRKKVLINHLLWSLLSRETIINEIAQEVILCLAAARIFAFKKENLGNLASLLRTPEHK